MTRLPPRLTARIEPAKAGIWLTLTNEHGRGLRVYCGPEAVAAAASIAATITTLAEMELADRTEREAGISARQIEKLTRELRAQTQNLNRSVK